MPESNTAPVARDVTTAVNENVQQAESSDKDVAVSSDDADGDTLSITKVVYRDQNDQIKTSTLTANTWNFLYSKYGRLLIHSGTGRYFYDASSTNSDYDAGTQGLSANTSSFNRVNELDAGDSASETFTYTLSDGTDTDTGTITVNITGINDDPIAANDQNTIEEGGTIARSSTEDERSLLNNDTDVDGDDDKSNFKVLLAKKGNSEQEGESTPTDWTEGNLNQTTRPSATIRGNYGSLTIYYDGTYTYTADSQIAGLDSGETVSDYFNYLVSDDSNGYEPNIPQDTRSVPNNQNSYAVLQITITGVYDPAVNAAPSVTNDTAYVYEDFTVTALDGASANDGFSTSPFIGLNAISADSDAEVVVKAPEIAVFLAAEPVNAINAVISPSAEAVNE